MILSGACFGIPTNDIMPYDAGRLWYVDTYYIVTIVTTLRDVEGLIFQL